MQVDMKRKGVLARILRYIIPHPVDPETKATELLKQYGRLNRVVELSYYATRDRNDMTESSAMFLSAVPGLARALRMEEFGPHPVFNRYVDLLPYLDGLFMGKYSEELYMIALDRKNSMIAARRLMRGTDDTVEMPVKIVIAAAQECQAERIVLCHNHPGQNGSFSKEDLQSMTQFLQLIALAEVAVVDHVLYAGDEVHSMRGESQIPDELWIHSGKNVIPREQWLNGMTKRTEAPNQPPPEETAALNK